MGKVLLKQSNTEIQRWRGKNIEGPIFPTAGTAGQVKNSVGINATVKKKKKKIQQTCLHSVLCQLFPVPTLCDERQSSYSLGQSTEKRRA